MKRYRYKLSPDEIMRRRRYGDLRKLFNDRYGKTLPDDEAGESELYELLLPVSLAPYEVRPGAIKAYGPNERMLAVIKQWAPWMGPNRALVLIDEINQLPIWERKPKAGPLGKRLNLTYAVRKRLDSKYPGVYRIALPSGRLSDMANLSWAKSLTLDAAERELAYETARSRSMMPLAQFLLFPAVLAADNSLLCFPRRFKWPPTRP